MVRTHPAGHLSSCRSQLWGICPQTSKKSSLHPGLQAGHLSTLLTAVNILPFSIFHWKICLSGREATNTLKRYVWFSLHDHHPTPQYFCIRLSGKDIASRHRDQFARGGNKIMKLLEEFKGKDTLFESEWLGQKGLEKLCKIFEN